MSKPFPWMGAYLIQIVQSGKIFIAGPKKKKKEF